jgi:predicted nucleotidyltransferase
LSNLEAEAIIVAVKEVFGANAHVWLFGSRIDDSKRGGDIDLYVECELQNGIALAKVRLLGQLASTFGEQKIDVLIQSTVRPQHPLGEIAKSKGLQLG